MKRYVITLLAVLAVVSMRAVGSWADEEHRPVAPSEELVKKLSEVILKHCPDAKIEVTKYGFFAKHGTMPFTVHGRSMTGEISRETHEEEGPNFKGFMLRVSLVDGKYFGQVGVPQTITGPYFPTFIDAPATADGKHHHSVGFSYGSQLDPKLKKAIFDAIPKTKLGLPDPSK